MGVGATFPTQNDTFTMPNPGVTQTLWNEVSRAVMATQRGLGGGVGDLSEAWNAKQTTIKEIIANRMAFDMGSITLSDSASGSYAHIATTETIDVTFTSGIFAGFQKEDIRIFCPMQFQPPWDDSSGATHGAGLHQSSVGNIIETGTVGVDVAVTGFSFFSKAHWPVGLPGPYAFTWFAVAGGNDGSGNNGSTPNFPTEGWDYW